MEPVTIVLYVSAFILLYLTITFVVLFALKHSVIHFRPRELEDRELPSLSVVMPVYNEGDALRRTLDAIVRCDYPKEKLEVLAVDDASRDISHEIAKEYERYPWFRAVKKERNSGTSDTKNTGISMAKGELVATLDSDSVVDKDAFRKLACYFEEDGVSAVSAAIRVREPKGIIERVQAIEYDSILFLRRLMMAVDSIYVTPGGLSMFRRQDMMDIGGFDRESLTEDQEVALKLQKKGKKIRCALDAFVYTSAMPSLSMLVKQRIRWVRGGIWNRVKHRDLFSAGYGDFLYFGMMTDIMVFIPSILMICSIIANIFKPQMMWMERIGLENVALGFLSDPLLVITGSMVSVTFLWLVYMVNGIRAQAKERGVDAIKEFPEIFSYLFLFGYLWPYIWVASLVKEIVGSEKKWSTR